MSNVDQVSSKGKLFYGFGYRYLVGITDEEDIIKGGSFYAFNKKFLTIAVSNTEWVDVAGEPYKFRLDGRVLFIKKVAIGFILLSGA